MNSNMSSVYQKKMSSLKTQKIVPQTISRLQLHDYDITTSVIHQTMSYLKIRKIATILANKNNKFRNTLFNTIFGDYSSLQHLPLQYSTLYANHLLFYSNIENKIRAVSSHSEQYNMDAISFCNISF
jgi:hypothetical protein